MINRKKIKSLLLFCLAFSFVLTPLPHYVTSASAQAASVGPSDDTGSARTVKRKRKARKPRVRYRDENVVLGIRKEVYFDFPLGNIKGPTDLSIFRYEVNKKEQDPKLAKDRVVLTGLKPGITDLWIYDNQDVLRIVYNVTVTPQNLKRVLGFLKQELKNV